MKHLLIATLALASSAAMAQYASPRAVQPAAPTPAQRPAPQLKPAAPAVQQPGQTGQGEISPVCFEPIDPRDTALTAALHANSLLCPTSTKTGAPFRLIGGGNGEIRAESKGPATVWHRAR
ncbi:hypothetical protein [Paucibacter soli]|uniref:hypothetical protein n=1 Tax=Paucibacter soli TaxID=3133433 RepID=UPI0030A2A039